MYSSYQNRGAYNHRNMGRQLLCFDNISHYGKATPTDIDGLIEYHDKQYVLLEIKRKGVQVLYGQRVALERMVNDFRKAGKEAIAVVAEHTVFDPSEDVDVAECLVREIYYSGERVWRPPKRLMNVRTLLDSFLLP